MLEILEDTNATASLSYGLLIFSIIVDALVDISMYTTIEESATYDSRTFSSMGYTLIDKTWHKESLKLRLDAIKETHVSTDSSSLLLKEAEELKTHMVVLKSNMQVMQETIEKVLQLRKDTSFVVGKIHIAMHKLKKEGVCSINKFLKQYDSIKIGADSTHNEMAFSIQTSYSNFSKNVECSYNSFCGNILNTLKFFLGFRWLC